MALRSKLRSLTLHRYRAFSTSTPTLDTKTQLNSEAKSGAIQSLLLLEEHHPERILDICLAASLSPVRHRDRVTYSLAISKLKESQDFESIRRLIKESLARSELRYDRVVSHFIVLYGKAGLVSDAIKLFDEMSDLGIERNVKTLNALLFSCSLGNNYGEMKRVFKDFPDKYNLVPNLDTYNTVLTGMCVLGCSDTAVSILAQMERNGVMPDSKSFNTLIAAFYADGKLSQVGKLIDMMKKHGMVPGISIYNAIIKNLCKLKRSTEAKELLDKILSREIKPNSETYTHLIYGFCLEGKLDEAKSLFNDMAWWGLMPERNCYSTLVHFLCEGRDFVTALDICKKCMAKGWFPNFSIMLSLVKGLVSIGKVGDAREVISRTKGFFPKNADKWTEIEAGLPES